MDENVRVTSIADHMIRTSDSLFGWAITGIYVDQFAFSFRVAPRGLRQHGLLRPGNFAGARSMRKNA